MCSRADFGTAVDLPASRTHHHISTHITGAMDHERLEQLEDILIDLEEMQEVMKMAAYHAQRSTSSILHLLARTIEHTRNDLSEIIELERENGLFVNELGAGSNAR
jgi:uncharacterized protein YuzE